MWSVRDEVTVREWFSSLSASLEGIVIASPPSRAGIERISRIQHCLEVVFP